MFFNFLSSRNRTPPILAFSHGIIWLDWHIYLHVKSKSYLTFAVFFGLGTYFWRLIKKLIKIQFTSRFSFFVRSFLLLFPRIQSLILKNDIYIYIYLFILEVVSKWFNLMDIWHDDVLSNAWGFIVWSSKLQDFRCWRFWECKAWKNGPFFSLLPYFSFWLNFMGFNYTLS